MVRSKYSREQKARAVALVMGGQATEVDICAEMEVAASTFRDWRVQFAEEAGALLGSGGDAETEGEAADAGDADGETVEVFDVPIVVDCGRDSGLAGPIDLHRVIVEGVGGLDAALRREVPEGDAGAVVRDQMAADLQSGHTVVMGRAAWYLWTHARPEELQKLQAHGGIAHKGLLDARTVIRYQPGLEDLMLIC